MEQPHPTRLLADYNSILLDSQCIYRTASRRLGVPEATLWILYSLRTEEPPVTQTLLCHLNYQSKQTINSALKNLEASGAIRLSPGKDRRTSQIFLTQHGLALPARTADRVIAAEEAALAELSPEEQQAMIQTQQKFNQLLRQKLEKNTMEEP